MDNLKGFGQMEISVRQGVQQNVLLVKIVLRDLSEELNDNLNTKDS